MSLRAFTARFPLSAALRPAVPTVGAAAVISSKNMSSKDKYDVPYDPNEATYGAAPIGTKDTQAAFKDTDTYTGASSAHSAKSAATQTASNAANTASRAAGKAANAASRTADEATNAASRTADGAADTASDVADKAQDAAQRVAGKARAAAEDMKNKFQSSGKTDVGSGSGHGVPGETGNPIYDAADKVGEKYDKNVKGDRESTLSSGGAVGSKFNPDGPIGSIAQKIGGPFAKDGIIGRQFDASGGGIAGTVEKMVHGPSQKKPGDPEHKGPTPGKK